MSLILYLYVVTCTLKLHKLQEIKIPTIKETGATFTPEGMANVIAKKIIESYDFQENIPLTITDPSCGNGILLSAIDKQIPTPNLITLKGYDINADYLKETKFRSYKSSLEVYQDDFLSIAENIGGLFGSQEQEKEKYDIIISNPPYVRTQILGQKYAQKLAKQFGLKGRVDLYYAFLVQIAKLIKENGILGVVTSNRFLSTKSGISVRKHFEENYEIIEVIDLGDTDLFDAAVLPAITIARRVSNPKKTKTKFTKIYKDLSGDDRERKKKDTVYDLLESNDGYYLVDDVAYKKDSGTIKFMKDKESTWTLLTSDETLWVDTIHSNSKGFVKNYFKVRVGIKSTADEVFLDTRDKGKFDCLEQEIIYELITSKNIQKWSLGNKTNIKVLYPYNMDSEKREVLPIKNYPKAYSFLKEHEERLRSRKYLIDGGREWYELWVPQKPSYWKLGKLVFPDISSTARFFYDNTGRIVNGNCYWIPAFNEKQERLLALIQGITNTEMMTRYHDIVFCNKLYSGKRRYMSQYVENYPIPNPELKESQHIIDIVYKLRKAKKEEISILQLELEQATLIAFGLIPK